MPERPLGLARVASKINTQVSLVFWSMKNVTTAAMESVRSSSQTRSLIHSILRERILVLDGATGTMLQALGVDDAKRRGERFKDHPADLKNLYDVLCLTQPEIVAQIHRAYLDAGADIVETNTFQANTVSLVDFNLTEIAYEMNKAGGSNRT